MLTLPAVVLLAVTSTQDPAACPEDEPQGPRGPYGALRVGFSAWRASMEVQLRGGWAFDQISAGVALEHNPFIDLNRPDMSAGVMGFGAFLTYRPMLTPRVGLRFGVLAGGSVLLFDTLGYERGQMGLWLGAEVMGLSIAVGKHLCVIIDVVDLSLPAIRLTSMPLLYQQWRWSVGLEFR
jgi:hypothetical protein